MSFNLPVPVVARSKAKVCCRSPAEIVGSNPTEGMDVCLLCVVCCQVELSATSWSLVQRSPTDSVGVVVCDLETSWMRRPWPPGGCCAQKNVNLITLTYLLLWKWQAEFHSVFVACYVMHKTTFVATVVWI
jgi:hypothetical protein